MYSRIAFVDLNKLMTGLVDKFLSGDLRTCLLFYAIIGLLAGLTIRAKGSSIILNILCSLAGAIVGGYLYMLTIGSFYGVIGSLAASVAGAVVFLLLRRGFLSGDQST